MLLSLCISIDTNAAFRIKKSVIAEAPAVVAQTPGYKPVISKKEQRRETISTLKRLMAWEGNGHHQGHHSSSGWEGIVALVCGILGVFTGYLAIPAIIFGAIGMGKGHRNSGLALAGFILGIVTVVIYAVVILLLAAAFGGIW
jgi:hypothetical protein